MMFPGLTYMPDYMSWMMAGSFVFWALLALLAFIAVVRFVRPQPQDDPRAILARRFARGEIDEKEYRSTLTLLGA